MLHVGLDLSRRRLDFHALDERGETVAVDAVAPDADGLHHLSARFGSVAVRAAIESMNGARFVHDQLELAGWEVEIADAARVKGLAPLACKTDRIDARVLAERSWRELVPAVWLPDPAVREERGRARFRLHLVRHRTSLKNRVHATLLAHGLPCPVSDLFGRRGRALLERLALPEPWRGAVEASLRLIDQLDADIDASEREPHALGADHPYVPLLRSVPGIDWVLADTIAAEIGAIERFPSPEKLAGYSGLCPRVHQSGDSDRRGPLSKQGPPLPALGPNRGHRPRLPPARLRRPLPADEAPAGEAARPQGRPRPARAHPRPRHLAHAHPQPALRSGKRPGPPGRLTAHKELRARSQAPHHLFLPEEAIER
jgi:transposase